MSVESLEKHLMKVAEKRERIFLNFLGYTQRNLKSFQEFYFFVIIVSSLNFLTASLFLDKEENPYLVKVSLVISLSVIIFSLARYLSYIENEYKKFYKKYKEIDMGYGREVDIIKDFYSGEINTAEIRNFYTSKINNLESDKNFNHFISFTEWIAFIFLSVSVILTVLYLV